MHLADRKFNTCWVNGSSNFHFQLSSHTFTYTPSHSQALRRVGRGGFRGTVHIADWFPVAFLMVWSHKEADPLWDICDGLENGEWLYENLFNLFKQLTSGHLNWSGLPTGSILYFLGFSLKCVTITNQFVSVLIFYYISMRLTVFSICLLKISHLKLWTVCDQEAKLFNNQAESWNIIPIYTQTVVPSGLGNPSVVCLSHLRKIKYYTKD